MNKRDNPYTPGAGRKPRTLAGRDEELESFVSLVERLGAGTYERSPIYTGLRGVGKTVLLMEFDVLASEAGWATTDVQEVGTNADFRATFARMAARLLVNMSRRHRAKQRIERALAVVKAFSVAIPGAVELKLDVDAATGVADSGDPEQDLADLFCEVGEVARANRMGAAFLVDEMQNLNAESLSAICMAVQAISRAGLPVAVVGAGLPELKVRLLAAKPYADRLFSYAELGRLSDVAARSALVGPAAAAGVDFDEAAARQVVDEAAGFPYFIQEYGRELWNYAESAPITTPISRRPGSSSRTAWRATSSAPASRWPQTPNSAISPPWRRSGWVPTRWPRLPGRSASTTSERCRCTGSRSSRRDSSGVPGGARSTSPCRSSPSS